MRAEAAIPVTRQVSQDHVYAVQGAIADYVVLERRCPDVLEGLVNRGLLEHYQLTDDWGQPISFRCWSNAPHLSVMVWSPGPDGRDSTPDDVRDHRFIRHVLDRN